MYSSSSCSAEVITHRLHASARGDSVSPVNKPSGEYWESPPVDIRVITPSRRQQSLYSQGGVTSSSGDLPVTSPNSGARSLYAVTLTPRRKSPSHFKAPTTAHVFPGIHSPSRVAFSLQGTRVAGETASTLPFEEVGAGLLTEQSGMAEYPEPTHVEEVNVVSLSLDEVLSSFDGSASDKLSGVSTAVSTLNSAASEITLEVAEGSRTLSGGPSTPMSGRPSPGRDAYKNKPLMTPTGRKWMDMGTELTTPGWGSPVSSSSILNRSRSFFSNSSSAVPKSNSGQRKISKSSSMNRLPTDVNSSPRSSMLAASASTSILTPSRRSPRPPAAAKAHIVSPNIQLSARHTHVANNVSDLLGTGKESTPSGSKTGSVSRSSGRDSQFDAFQPPNSNARNGNHGNGELLTGISGLSSRQNNILSKYMK
jgi:hypothetical protein